LDVPVLGTALALLFKATGRRSIEKQLEQAFAPAAVPKRYHDKFLGSLFRLSQIKAAVRDEITLNPALRRMSPNYGTIHLPVVIVTGDSDKEVLPDKQSYLLHANIAQSQLIVVPNAGHELQFTSPLEVLHSIDLAMQSSLTREAFLTTDAERLVESTQ
jgi:pimeloyl-ACP methyl ester carboxylesterase